MIARNFVFRLRRLSASPAKAFNPSASSMIGSSVWVTMVANEFLGLAMSAEAGANSEHALPLFQIAKRAIQQASQRECPGFRGLERLGHVLRLTRGNDGLHWLWCGNRD